MLLEELIRAGAVLATIDRDGRVRATDLLPILGFAGEDERELIKRQFLYRIVRAYVNGQTVHGDFVFGRALAEGCETSRDLGRLDLARRVTQVGGLILQRGETRARAAAGDLDFHVGMIAHVSLGPFLGED